VGGLDWGAPVSYPRQRPAICFDNSSTATGCFAAGRRGESQGEYRRLAPHGVHQEIPDLSRRARESIRGVIKIAVRVIVDRSGNVVAATLDNRRSSKYFARAAMDAAWKWKFAQAPDQASRV
jgi:hypothetical protein